MDIAELLRLLVVLGVGELVEAVSGHGGVPSVAQGAEEVVARHPRGELFGEVLERVIEVAPDRAVAGVEDEPVVGREAVFDAHGVEQREEGIKPVAANVAGGPFAVHTAHRLAERGSNGPLAAPEPDVGI